MPLRILLVSPYFAPAVQVGAKRFSFLVQELEKLGHEVDILTLPLDRNDRSDSSLPQAGRIHRIGSLLPVQGTGTGLSARIYNRVLGGVIGIPDRFVGWLPPSYMAGRRIAKASRPDVVVATGPPFTAFLVGSVLSRVTDARLVCDYRDPWTAYNWSPVGPRRKAGRLAQRMERWVLGRAHAAVFSTYIMRQQFEGLYDGQRPSRLAIITNGFIEPGQLESRPLSSNCVNILYAGNFYGERRLSTLLQALQRISRVRSSGDPQFAVHVFGKIKDDDRARINSDGLDHLVHEHAPVDHGSVLEFMKGADILFLPSGGDVAYALPFKLFDYLSVRRPILAVTPDQSAVAELVRKLDCGEVAVADDVGEITSALERLLGRAQPYRYRGIERFTWKAIAHQYHELLQAVVAAPG